MTVDEKLCDFEKLCESKHRFRQPAENEWTTKGIRDAAALSVCEWISNRSRLARVKGVGGPK